MGKYEVINIWAHCIFCWIICYTCIYKCLYFYWKYNIVGIISVIIYIENKEKILLKWRLRKSWKLLKCFVFHYCLKIFLSYVNAYHEHLFLWIYKLYFYLLMSVSWTSNIWGKQYICSTIEISTQLFWLS